MPTRTIDVDREERKRQLRLQIGRLRRQIDNRVHSTAREARRLSSWRAYVQRYPGYAVLTALGVGLAASAGLRSSRLTRRLGMPLVRRAAKRVGYQLWQDLLRAWTKSSP